MNIVQIEVWTGFNFSEIVNKISTVNTETTIRVIGKRIIIHDKTVDYYQNVVVGDKVEIPIYEDCLICDEEPEEEEEEDTRQYISEELLNQMLIEWGLR